MRTYLTIIFTICFFLEANHVFSCSCRNVSVRNSIISSDIVFKGKVLKTYLTTNYDSLGVKVEKSGKREYLDLEQIPMRVALIVVDTVYKGISKDSITILTPFNGAACGIRFFKDEEYIIYAQNKNFVIPEYSLDETQKNISFFTHLCTTTSIFYKVEEDYLIEELSKLE